MAAGLVTTPARAKNMKNITMTNYDGLTEIARRSQTQMQYGNVAVVLYRVTDAMPGLNIGDVVYIEEAGLNNEYLLDSEEADAALQDSETFLRDCASAWADSSDDPCMERYQWGVSDPDDDAVRADDDSPCKIVVKGCYYGYTPYNYATDERGETLIFDHAAAAQAWIDEQEAGRYVLGHNEAGRPTCYVVAA